MKNLAGIVKAWIILTNSNKIFAKQLTQKIEDWLKTYLKLTLWPEKTLVTNIKKDKAKLLGFSVYTYKFRRFSKGKLGNTLKDAGFCLAQLSGMKGSKSKA